MLQDSYIIAPLGLVHDQGGYNAKIKRWNVVFCG